MIIDNETRTVYIRQSWLDTAMRCPEEGRLAVVKNWDGTTDEAFIGTAAHAGIEAFLNGADMVEARALVAAEYRTNPEARDLKFTKRSSLEECVDLSQRCFDAWVKDIYPHIPKGGKAEVDFNIKVFDHRGYAVHIKGTSDYVPADGNVIWDWKTAGSDYQQKKKQKWAIQPTIYGTAGVLGALGRDGFSFPLEFTYGIMVKLKKECRGQIVTVQRTEAHRDWAFHRIRTLLDLAMDFGFDKPWPQIDEDNYLCSPTWCDYYSICRGAFIEQSHDLFGYNPK